MRKQQLERLAEQKRQIVNNPTIPLPQKQQMVAQLDRSIAEASAGPGQGQASSSPDDRNAQMQAKQKQWIEARMQEVRNNPMMPPAQKQQTPRHGRRPPWHVGISNGAKCSPKWRM
ncbi:MAG: hypothetical protein H7835_19160, partial [Magnetococcus sp. XQGC-1]